MSKALTLQKTVSYSNWTDGTLNYLNDIRKYEILSAEEEIELFNTIKNGSPEEAAAAREKIIISNQRFVYKIAKTYVKGDDIMDIVNECNIGMIKAMDKYDPRRGIRFLSFAVWYIRREVLSYITNNGTMIRSSNKQKLMGALPKAKESFYQENLREATPEELMEILEKEYGIKIKNEEDLYEVNISSLNSNLVGEEETPSPTAVKLDAITASENEYEEEADSEYLSYMVEGLLSACDEKERTIVKMLYGIDRDSPMPAESVADELSMTATRVNQIHKNALKKMRKYGATVKVR